MTASSELRVPDVGNLPPGAAPETILEIPLERVSVHPRNPRRDVGDLKGLAQSIRSQGVLEPIVVVERDGGYLAVIGSRRLAASRVAGRATIPAVVREMTEAQAATASLTENVQRTDLDPIERAESYRELLKLNGWTQAQLAEHIGKLKQPTIANSLRLLTLPADSPVRVALIRRQITEAHALVTLRVRDPRLVAQLPLDVTVRELRERVERLLAAGAEAATTRRGRASHARERGSPAKRRRERAKAKRPRRRGPPRLAFGVYRPRLERLAKRIGRGATLESILARAIRALERELRARQRA